MLTLKKSVLKGLLVLGILGIGLSVLGPIANQLKVSDTASSVLIAGDDYSTGGG